MQHRVKRRVIAMLVAEAFDVSPSLLDGPTRDRTVVRARQAAWLLIKHHWFGHYTASTTEIGLLLGGRDHTTVMYGLERAVYLLVHDRDFASRFREARRSIATWKPRPLPQRPIKASDLMQVAQKRETPPAVNVVAFRSTPKIVRQTSEDAYEFWRRESCWNSEQRYLALAMREHPNLVRVPQIEAAE